MKNITKHILTYRKVLMNLWNQNFVIELNSKDDFIFEIDKAFSFVEKGLFDSLVVAKAFDSSIERSKEGYFTEIMVTPVSTNIKAMAAKKKVLEYNWENLEGIPNDCIFKYLDLFDWDTEEGMNCEYIRVRLTESNTLRKYVGFDFLFRFNDVEIYKI